MLAESETIDQALIRWQRCYPLNTGLKRVYLSTPINTGPYYVDWWKNVRPQLDPNSEAYRCSFETSVRARNIADAVLAAESLKLDSNEFLINPANFEEPVGWTQEMFASFWDEVIKRYIDRVVFLDGWQFSNGCCWEFASAIRKQIPCLDKHQFDIPLSKGINLISQARADLAYASMDTAVQDAVLSELNDL